MKTTDFDKLAPTLRCEECGAPAEVVELFFTSTLVEVWESWCQSHRPGRVTGGRTIFRIKRDGVAVS